MEEEQSLYFTPRQADFRVDYEYEYLQDSIINEEGALVETWIPMSMKGGSALPLFEDIGKYRTKFLSNEEIVSAGWKEEGVIVPIGQTYQKIDAYKFTRGNYTLIYYRDMRSLTIYIDYKDMFAIVVQGYRCPSKNELIYIFNSVEFS